MAYEINYNDERFQNVESEKQQALTDLENTYNGIIQDSDKHYQDQIDLAKQWGETQSKLQDERTDFAIKKIEQEKEKAQKDYLKEQSGAYTDYKKQTGEYGANAEQLASQGLIGSGYSESSKVSMYNEYQQRIASARQSIEQANLNFSNSIQQAMLENNSAKAQIAYETLQKQLELALSQFQYKNSMLLELSDKKHTINNTYYSRWQDVLQQMNTENALQEQIRQYNEQFEYQKEQDEKNYQLQLDKLAEDKRQFDASLAASRSSGGSSSGNAGSGLDVHGNNAATQAKKDFYFSNGYQPRYINNQELSKTGLTIKDLPSGLGLPAGQNVWKVGKSYYVWDGTTGTYLRLSGSDENAAAKAEEAKKKSGSSTSVKK